MISIKVFSDPCWTCRVQQTAKASKHTVRTPSLCWTQCSVQCTHECVANESPRAREWELDGVQEGCYS